MNSQLVNGVQPEIRSAVIREFQGGALRTSLPKDVAADPGVLQQEYLEFLDALRGAGLDAQSCGPEDVILGSANPGDLMVPIGRRRLLICRTSRLHDPSVAARIATRAGCARALEIMPEGMHLSGCDVLSVGTRLLVAATNLQDNVAEYLQAIACEEGMEVEIVPVRNQAPLRDVASVLLDGSLLYAAGSLPKDALPGVERVFAGEAVGASAIAGPLGVVLAAEAPVTAQILEARGFPIIPTWTGQLCLGRGGLSRLAGCF